MGSKLSAPNKHEECSDNTERTRNFNKSDDMRRQPIKRRDARRSSPITSSSMCSYSTASTSHPSELSRASQPPQYPLTPSPGRQRSRLTSDQQRRIFQADRILGMIAKEYAIKRAAGLVPTIPVPARTLLWEEMARNATRHIAQRGQCVYGRDCGPICGCTTYQKQKNMPDQNPGGICACCQHGGPWHRLQGGHNMRPSCRSSKRYSQGMSDRYSREEEEFYSDSEMDEDSESDEESIANEVARPYDLHSNTQASFCTSNYGRLSSSRLSVQALIKMNHQNEIDHD